MRRPTIMNAAKTNLSRHPFLASVFLAFTLIAPSNGGSLRLMFVDFLVIIVRVFFCLTTYFSVFLRRLYEIEFYSPLIFKFFVISYFMYQVLLLKNGTVF